MPPAVSVASIVVAVTIKPPEDLPEDTHAQDVLDELESIIDEAVRAWHLERGHEFLVRAPHVA